MDKILTDNPAWESIYNILKAHLFGIPLRQCLECKQDLPWTSRKSKQFCSSKCSNNSELTKSKQQTTCFKNHGVRFPLQSDSIKKKSKHTLIVKYGVTNIQQSKLHKSKTMKTMIDRYGVSSASQLSAHKETLKKCRHADGWKLIQTFSEHIIPLFTKESYHRHARRI